MEIRNMLAARGRSHKDGFPTVGAVCDRAHFANSRKNARSQTAPTIDTANSADFCHGLLEIDPERPFFQNSVSETKNLRSRNLPKTGFPDRSLVSACVRIIRVLPTACLRDRSR